MEENPKITDKRLANLKTDAGPGRPKGQRNYATIYREALVKLAEMNGMEPEQMETDILLKGLASARKGDYRFWKDMHDRLHGTAPQRIKQESTIKMEVNNVTELPDEELINLTRTS
jgi:hypothetical protein